MIEVKNLTKAYGGKKALDDLSFTVGRGEILGFLGPNGAGKSTAMNIITGYISSTAGTVQIDGFDVLKDTDDCKKRVGYLPEQPPVYMDMTVMSYLEFVCEIKGVKKADRKSHIDDILGKLNIADIAGRLIGNLSKGYRQRVGIAQALIGDPEVLILDEPTVGLDPAQIIEVRNVIKELGGEKTVIFSSHILSEISAVCERVIIINNGRFVAEDTPENLSKKLCGNKFFLLRAQGDRESITQALAAAEGVASLTCEGSSEEGTFDFSVESNETADVRRSIFERLCESHIPLLMIKPHDFSLEDVFIKLTSEETGGGAEPDGPEFEQEEENANEGDL